MGRSSHQHTISGVLNIRTVYDLWDTLCRQVNGQIRTLRGLVYIVHTREPRDLSAPCFSIHALAVRLLTVLKWGSHMDQEEVATCTARLEDGVASSFARAFVWSNGCRNDGSPCTSELRSNKRDPLHVLMTVRGGESEFCLCN